jgi:hypothetical protein
MGFGGEAFAGATVAMVTGLGADLVAGAGLLILVSSWAVGSAFVVNARSRLAIGGATPSSKVLVKVSAVMAGKLATAGLGVLMICAASGVVLAAMAGADATGCAVANTEGVVAVTL